MKFAFAGIMSLAIAVISGLIGIPLLSKIKAGQPILSYVEEHKSKSGTPTMGGLFFVFAAIITYFFFEGKNGRISYVVIAIGFSYLIVGFLDDFIKIKNRHNLGLRAYQKIGFQIVIGVIAGVFCYLNRLTVFYLPFSMRYIDCSYWTIPLVSVVFIATTNSVNLTDGLDGLASGVSIVYLVLLFSVIALQLTNFKLNYPDESEYRSLMMLIVCFIGALFGFLCFNTNRARVFMGDTGALSLGGFLGGLSIFSGNLFFIPIFGIMFVLSSISVILQVIYYKRTGRRIFLMAPLHHHFQHKGYTEAQICYYYCLATLVIGLFAVLVYL